MPSDERADILAAMDRLLDGIPLRCDGKLTIVALATEAGVKRHLLTHKHTDLRDRFYARVKARTQPPAQRTADTDAQGELRRQLGVVRAERDSYRNAADALARALNVLTIENDALRRRLARPNTPPGPAQPADPNVLPLRPGPKPPEACCPPIPEPQPDRDRNQVSR